MKKISIKGKLNLNKEIVTNLNEAQLKAIIGGRRATSYARYRCAPTGVCKCFG